MADTITMRTDSDLEHAREVLTRDGTNRSEAIRRAGKRRYARNAWLS